MKAQRLVAVFLFLVTARDVALSQTLTASHVAEDTRFIGELVVEAAEKRLETLARSPEFNAVAQEWRSLGFEDFSMRDAFSYEVRNDPDDACLVHIDEHTNDDHLRHTWDGEVAPGQAASLTATIDFHALNRDVIAPAIAPAEVFWPIGKSYFRVSQSQDAPRLLRLTAYDPSGGRMENGASPEDVLFFLSSTSDLYIPFEEGQRSDLIAALKRLIAACAFVPPPVRDPPVTDSDNRSSQRDMDALRGQIQRCWNIPAGALDASSLRVSVKFRLDRNGDVVGKPELVEWQDHPVGREAAESAVRAIMQCAPYELPPEKHSVWAEVIVHFDPTDMF